MADRLLVHILQRERGSPYAVIPTLLGDVDGRSAGSTLVEAVEVSESIGANARQHQQSLRDAIGGRRARAAGEAYASLQRELRRAMGGVIDLLASEPANDVDTIIFATDDLSVCWSCSPIEVARRYEFGVIGAQWRGKDAAVGPRVALPTRGRPNAALVLGGDPNLPALANELGAVEKSLKRVSVTRPARATARDAFNALHDGANADLIYFAGHVDEKGNPRFADGSKLTPDTLEGARFTRSPVVVLNGCGPGAILGDVDLARAGTPTRFLRAGAQACVLHQMPVRDDVAGVFGPAVVYALMDGYTTARAVALAKKRTVEAIRADPLGGPEAAELAEFALRFAVVYGDPHARICAHRFEQRPA